MKKIFLLVFLLAITGAGIGYKIYHQPHEDIHSAKPDVVISATELFAAYQLDEATANAKFLDKKIQVSGKIMAVETDEKGKTGISLDAGGMLGGVICKLDNLTDHPRTQFAVGEAVTFKGICTGTLMDVVLERCVEVDK